MIMPFAAWIDTNIRHCPVSTTSPNPSVVNVTKAKKTWFPDPGVL